MNRDNWVQIRIHTVVVEVPDFVYGRLHSLGQERHMLGPRGLYSNLTTFIGYRRAPIISHDVDTRHCRLRHSWRHSQERYTSGLLYSPRLPLSSHKQLPSAFMSHSHLTAGNFQLLFNNALNAYEKRTKKDLLVHPLASRLQACASPDEIFSIFQEQVQGLDQSQSNKDRMNKWLDPTVNTLSALSATLGEEGGAVSLRT